MRVSSPYLITIIEYDAIVLMAAFAGVYFRKFS